MAKVLFVCTGNTCRSPMAEVIAKDYFQKNNLPWSASSRGINVMVPERASSNAKKAVSIDFGLDLSEHISRQLDEKALTNADLVITMTTEHKMYLQMVYPTYKEKIYAFSDFFGNKGKEITDPYGRDLYVFKECAKVIAQCIANIDWKNVLS